MCRCALSIFICLQFYWDFWIFRFMFSSNVGIDELGISLEYFFCPLSLSPVLQWPVCQATWHCSISHWGLFKSISDNKKFFNYFTLILVCLLQKTGHVSFLLTSVEPGDMVSDQLKEIGRYTPILCPKGGKSLYWLVFSSTLSHIFLCLLFFGHCG